MKFILACLLSVVAANDFALFGYSPVANPAAVVTSGNARFTVLTDRMIRMEYAEGAKFENRATLAFVNRNMSVPTFTKNSSGGVLTIATRSVKLSYTTGKAFAADTLTATSLDSKSAFKAWKYGDIDTGNLFGTIRTLDGICNLTLNCTENKGQHEPNHCAWGVMSRLGWTTIDDQDTPLLDAEFFLEHGANSTDTVDTYLLTHGHDYKGALYDYTRVGGVISMVPRWASGIMWSRWYDINNYDMRQIVEEYESHKMPLDVFILDMDWHQKFAWGGYTWDKNLFPAPEDTLGYLKSVKGLAISANVHDDDGVGTFDAMHDAMAEAMGLPTSTGKINFAIVNKTYTRALEDVVMNAISGPDGIDFWWIDWQQGDTAGGCKGGKENPTILLNHARHTDHMRRGESTRGLVLARFGGLGNHRYQVGFSGDVAKLDWSCLAYQPYFSATAANVGFGYWSHDIIGPPDDHEMHVRWIQAGLYSGAFRTHDRGMSAGGCADSSPGCPLVEIWKLPMPYLDAARVHMMMRDALMPYIYTQQRSAYENGVGLLRPMYYEWPEEEMAYASLSTGEFSQYYFGPDIITAPVVVPAGDDKMAETSIWLPEGTWVEVTTGFIHSIPPHGKVLTKKYNIFEVPTFVKAGAIIPTIPVKLAETTGLAMKQYSNLILTIYPGADSGSTRIYEDDGLSTAYLSGHYAWTEVSYVRNGTSITIHQKTEGSYPDFPSIRSFQIRLVNSPPLEQVTVLHKTLPYSRWGGAGTWSYDGPEVTAVVDLGNAATGPIQIETGKVDNAVYSGLRGGLNKAILSKLNLDETRNELSSHDPKFGYLSTAASTADQLSFLASSPGAFDFVVRNYTSLFAGAVKEVQGLTKVDPKRLAHSISLLENAYN